MSPGTAITNDKEESAFLFREEGNKPLEAGTEAHAHSLDIDTMSGDKKPSGPLGRLVILLEERISVKRLMRVWGVRLEFVVRLMLVATFLDDSLRTATNFSDLTLQIVGKSTLSPGLVTGIASVALGIGLLAQSLGSLCLLALFQPNSATKALIGWAIAQPVLYAQLSNLEFVSESLSLVGGLFLLRAHLVSDLGYLAASRTQLVGRLMLPAMYLYYAGIFLFSALTLDETNDLAMYVSSLSLFVLNTAALVGVVVGATLVAVGLKSRIVAVVLAVVNLGFVFYRHPFFRFVWLEGGEWKYDEENMAMPNVAMPADISPTDFTPSQIYDLHRYYFFLGLSTSGALLLLAQFGPGQIAVQSNEVVLPMVRAQD